MKNRIFFGVLIFLVLFLLCFLPSFSYYNSLSPEANIFLEELKEKYRVKKIVLEKEGVMIWNVILPKNNGVETEEIKEAVYNDETGEFEAIYNFTRITILNAEGWTKVILGYASKFYPYNMPKLCFVFND